MFGKILLVMDETDRRKVAFERYLRLAEMGLKGDVYLLFVKEMGVPPIVSEEGELSAYQRMMSDALRKLENAGLKVTDIKVTFSRIPDRILMLEKN